MAIGKLILTRFFAKDEAAWHARQRNKDHSIRKLARHPDRPFEKSALTEAVGVYVLVGRYPELRERTRLTPTHVGRTLSLKPAEAVALLKIADQRRWSVRELAFEAKQVRRAMGERRGRPVSSADRKAEIGSARPPDSGPDAPPAGVRELGRSGEPRASRLPVQGARAGAGGDAGRAEQTADSTGGSPVASAQGAASWTGSAAVGGVISTGLPPASRLSPSLTRNVRL